MHPTVAWILSRVGPSIRRVQRSSSYCTTVFVCITRLLAVVVSLKHCAGPPLLFISIIRQYCSTGTRTCYTLDICPLENRSVSYTLSRIGRYPSYIIFKLLTTVYDFCPAWRPALAASSYRVTKADPCWDHPLKSTSQPINKYRPTRNKPPNQTTNPPKIQTTNQPTNKTSNQSILFFNKPTNQQTIKSTNQPINLQINQPTNT